MKRAKTIRRQRRKLAAVTTRLYHDRLHFAGPWRLAVSRFIADELRARRVKCSKIRLRKLVRRVLPNLPETLHPPGWEGEARRRIALMLDKVITTPKESR